MASAFVEKIVDSALSGNNGEKEVTQSAAAVVKAGAATPVAEAIEILDGLGDRTLTRREAQLYNVDKNGRKTMVADKFRDPVAERYTEQSLDILSDVKRNLAKLTK